MGTEAVWGREGYREESAIESGFKGAYGIMNELGHNYNYKLKRSEFCGRDKNKELWRLKGEWFLLWGGSESPCHEALSCGFATDFQKPIHFATLIF